MADIPAALLHYRTNVVYRESLSMLEDVAAPLIRLLWQFLLLMLIASMAISQDSLRVASVEYRQTFASEKEEDAAHRPSRDHQPSVSGFWHASVLTGDWNGGRTWMADHGLEVAGVYKADGFANLRGGLERNAAYIHNIDFTLLVNMEKLVGWQGGSLFVDVLANNGGELSRYVGDVQVVSNIEAGRMTKLYQAWVQQEAWEGSVSLLAGVYDLNSEFYVTQTSGLFINSSHGIGKEFSQTGRNGPSIFPNAAAGVRLRLQPYESVYFQTVVLDGMPGDPDDPSRMQIHFNKEEGLLVTAEAGYASSGGETNTSGLAKLAVGVWSYTSQFDKLNEVDANGEPVKCTEDWGVYCLAEKSVYKESENPGQGLAAFARLGYASSCVNQFDYHFGVGAVYTGLFSSRDEDELGIAVAHAHNGREYRQVIALGGTWAKNLEVTAELTYKAQLTPWLALQPDVQYVIHPSTDPQIANALVFGSRFELAL
jgi:porin